MEVERRPRIGNPESYGGIERAIFGRMVRYSEIREARPDLRVYMPDDPGSRGTKLGNVRRLLLNHPELLTDLEAFRPEQEDDISLLIMPDYPLVLSKYQEQRGVLVPALACTQNAIADLFDDQPRVRGQYDIVSSGNLLEDLVWDKAMRGDKRALSYDSNFMNPEDYVALAAQGMLYNELFRLPLSMMELDKRR